MRRHVLVCMSSLIVAAGIGSLPGRALGPMPDATRLNSALPVVRVSDTGIDIVRMPPGLPPPVERQPAIIPASPAPLAGGATTASAPASAAATDAGGPGAGPAGAAARQDPQDPGADRQPVDRRPEGLARREDGERRSAARALARASQRRRRAHHRGDGGRPRGPGGPALRRHHHRLQRQDRPQHGGPAPAGFGDEPQHARDDGRVAHHHRRRRLPAHAAPAGRRRQRLRHVSPGPHVRGRASASPGTTPRACAGCARAPMPATCRP